MINYENYLKKLNGQVKKRMQISLMFLFFIYTAKGEIWTPENSDKYKCVVSPASSIKFKGCHCNVVQACQYVINFLFPLFAFYVLCHMSEGVIVCINLKINMNKKTNFFLCLRSKAVNKHNALTIFSSNAHTLIKNLKRLCIPNILQNTVDSDSGTMESGGFLSDFPSRIWRRYL